MTSLRTRLERVCTGWLLYETQLKKFSDKFAARPADALEWVAPTFTAAARYELATKTLDLLKTAQDPDTTAECWCATLKADVIHGAASPTCSTSVSGNEMARHRLAAKAHLLEELER